MSKEVLPPQEKVTWYICLRLPETLFPRLTFDTLNVYFLNDCETYWQLQATWKLKRHGDNAAQGKYNIANIKGNGSSTIKELTFGRFFFKFRPVFSAFLFAAHLFFEFLEKKRKHYSAYTVINTIYSNIAS